MPWLQRSPYTSARAFGVIGVSCVIPAISSISFTTDSFLGTLKFFGIGDRWYPTWGNRSNGVETENNTQLYVRVFEHWPRELTYYDVAHFAVFHFNPGLNDGDINVNYTIDYFDWVDAISEIPISQGSIIVKTGYISNNTVLGASKIKNISRRGLLLPSVHTMNHTIGLNNGASIKIIKSQDIGNNTFPATTHDCVIYNPGSRFKVGDKLIARGGRGTSPSFTVTQIDANGGIVDFIIDPVHFGYNYEPSDFASVDSPDGSDSSVRLAALERSDGQTGVDFDAKIIRGHITYAEITDKKPKEFSQLQLTKNSPQPEESNSNIDMSELIQPATTKTINIAKEDRSASFLYDAFFFMHNDITHTGMEIRDGVLSLENYITVQISST